MGYVVSEWWGNRTNNMGGAMKPLLAVLAVMLFLVLAM